MTYRKRKLALKMNTWLMFAQYLQEIKLVGTLIWGRRRMDIGVCSASMWCLTSML